MNAAGRGWLSASLVRLAALMVLISLELPAQERIIGSPSPWEPIRRELQRRWNLHGIDSTTVEVTRVPSRVVPRLEYVLGRYSLPDHNWMVREVTVLRRTDGTYVPVTDAAGWQAASGGWIPTTTEARKGACFEVAGLLSASEFPRGGPVVVDDSVVTGKLMIFVSDSAAFRRLTVPKESVGWLRRTGVWQFWVLEPGASVKFECSWRGGVFKLQRIDSVLGAGLMPSRH